MLTPEHRHLLEISLKSAEDDHARLDNLLRELGEICCNFENDQDCQNCSQERIASCQGRWVSYTHVFLEFVYEHIENEEKIMAEIMGAHHPDRLVHVQNHRQLVKEVEELLHQLSTLNSQSCPSRAIRMFYDQVLALLELHFQQFDTQLLKMLDPSNYDQEGNSIA